MDWSIYRIKDYPQDLWRDWQKMVDEYHQSNPMLDSVFVKLLVERFGSSERLYVAAAGNDDGTPEALGIFDRTDMFTLSSFQPSQAQVALFVVSPHLPYNSLDKIFIELPASVQRANIYALDPREHRGLLMGSTKSHFQVGARDICIDVQGDFNDYWMSRSKNLRKNMKRYEKRLESLNQTVRFQTWTRPSEVASAVERYGMLESKGWKAREGTALHPKNTQGRFYRDFLVEMAKQGRAVVFELQIDNRLVASRLCVTGQSILVIFKTTYDESEKRLAVGRILLKRLLEFVYQEELAKIVDFYTNASDDQLSWATSVRWQVNASLYRSRSAVRLAKRWTAWTRTAR